MISTPVEELAETLVELADTLSDDFDLDGFLRRLADRCVRILHADAAGLLLIDHDGQSSTVGASDERAARLELSEVRNEEGPAHDCQRSGDPVIVPDLATTALRWPRFAEAAAVAGYAAVHTVPLRLRAEVIGAMSLFRAQPGEFDKTAARLARTMADIATIGLLQERARRRQTNLATQLQYALNRRVVIEQAKGVVAERLGLGMGAAFESMRKYARSNNTRVSELASSIVDGEFDTGKLLQ